jgi:ribosomal-protein-alanine N-acetyltransferase
VTLRELTLRDAPALLAHVRKPRVFHYISPPPSTVAGFERFVHWVREERKRGFFVCYGVIPAGHKEPVGLIQVWPMDPTFQTAEWGFALDSEYWGTGLFMSAARLLLDFAFDRLGVHRLEARSVAENVRGSAVLRKLGATPEGVLRRSFPLDGVYRDHVMWSILADEWFEMRDRRRRVN